jgi:predicted transcriptional regulator
MSDKPVRKKIEYVNVTISFTPDHLARLDKLAHHRTLNRSVMVRALIDEEWKRERENLSVEDTP